MASPPPFPVLRELWDAYQPKLATLARSSQVSIRSVVGAAVLALPERPTPADIDGYLLGLGVAESTQNNYRSLLQLVYSNARLHGLAVNDAAGQVPRRKVRVVHHRPLGDLHETTPKVLAAMPDERARSFVGVLRFAGLRLGEALALERSHIDLRRDRMHVVQQRPPGGSLGARPEALKGPRQARWVPLHPQLRLLLEEVLDLPPVLVRVGRAGTGGERVVPWLHPYTRDHLRGSARTGLAPGGQPSLLERVRTVVPGFEDSRRAGKGGDRMGAWHEFRHSFALHCRSNGVPLSTLSSLLGHCSEATTSVYLREIGEAEVDSRDLAGVWAADSAALVRPFAPTPFEGEGPTLKGSTSKRTRGVSHA